MMRELIKTLQNNQFFDQDTEFENMIANCPEPEIHSRICHRMFEKVKSGEKVWIKIDDISDHDSEEQNHTVVAHMSIVSKEMLQYDFAAFQQIMEESETMQGNESINRVSKSYRPYFMNFIATGNLLTGINQGFFREDNIGRWFFGYFEDREDHDRRQLDGQFYIEGTIESSASPVIYTKKGLTIEGGASADIDAINNCYPMPTVPKSCSDVETKLNDMFSEICLYKARVYNVGNGNFIYISGKSKNIPKRIIYDIGYHNRSHPQKKASKSRYSNATYALRQIKPDCVILSHWDSDHIMGCVYAPQQIFDCLWFAPQCDAKDSTGAQRLASFLTYSKKLWSVERGVRKKAAVISGKKTEITLWLGQRNGENLSNANCQGLALEVHSDIPGGEEVKCLLQGDVPYKCLPDSVWDMGVKYDYLVVPHHGSNMDWTLLDHSSSEDKIAIVCACKKSGLPNRGHMDALDKNNYKVKLTKDLPIGIDIYLRKKGKVIER